MCQESKNFWALADHHRMEYKFMKCFVFHKVKKRKKKERCGSEKMYDLFST